MFWVVNTQLNLTVHKDKSQKTCRNLAQGWANKHNYPFYIYETKNRVRVGKAQYFYPDSSFNPPTPKRDKRTQMRKGVKGQLRVGIDVYPQKRE